MADATRLRSRAEKIVNHPAPRNSELAVCGVFLGLSLTLYNLDFLVTLLGIKSSLRLIFVQSVFVGANTCVFLLLFTFCSVNGRRLLICLLFGLAGFCLLETAQICPPLPGILGHISLARLFFYTAILALVGLSRKVQTPADRRRRLAVYFCLAGTVLVPLLVTIGFRSSLQRMSPVVSLLRPNEWLGKPVPSILLEQLAESGGQIHEYLVLADLDTLRARAFVSRVCDKVVIKPIVVIWIGNRSHGLESCRGLKMSRFNPNVHWVFEPLVVLRIKNGRVDQIDTSGESSLNLVSTSGTL